jgi:hypothetical protein
MPWLAGTILGAVFLTHAGSRWIASLTGANLGVIEFELHGALLAVLSGCLLVLLAHGRSSAWRDVGLTGCAISISEGLQMTTCMMLTPDIRAVPATANLCDYLSGQPIAATMLAIYVITLCLVVGWHHAR